MHRIKFFISLVLAVSVLIGQAGSALAAPVLQASELLTGTVKSITLETDPNTGITTVMVEVKHVDQTTQTARLSQETAVIVGLVVLDSDGNPGINKSALGRPVEIDAATVIPDQTKDRNPVGDALATFFSDVPGMEYEIIMAAHDEGVGFGLITQSLWLTKQLNGDSNVFEALLVARETGDYSAFTFDGVTPENWGQLRKAVLDGKKIDKANSDQNNGNNQHEDKGKDKDKNKDNSGNNGNDKDKGKNK